jgi:hypothetical protein
MNDEMLKADWEYIASRLGEVEVEEDKEMKEMTEWGLRGCHL